MTPLAVVAVAASDAAVTDASPVAPAPLTPIGHKKVNWHLRGFPTVLSNLLLVRRCQSTEGWGGGGREEGGG